MSIHALSENEHTVRCPSPSSLPEEVLRRDYQAHVAIAVRTHARQTDLDLGTKSQGHQGQVTLEGACSFCTPTPVAEPAWYSATHELNSGKGQFKLAQGEPLGLGESSARVANRSG